MEMMFAIYDNVAGLYNSPMFFVNEGVALREFKSACQDESSYLNRHPESYDLVRIASWDPETGQVTQDSPPAMIVSASAVIESFPTALEGGVMNVQGVSKDGGFNGS